jgi:hypothetical protein
MQEANAGPDPQQVEAVGHHMQSHLFAIGELPITGYEPSEREAAFASAWDKRMFTNS